MKVLKKTPRTRTVEVAGQTVKVTLKKRSMWNKGTARMQSSTTWSVDKLLNWSGSRKQLEAVLLAVDSGLSWDDAVNENQSNWVQNDSPALL